MVESHRARLDELLRRVQLERREDGSSFPRLRFPRTERIPKERKRNTLKLESSITIPTVYYLGFVRMQPQPDALQPISQRRPHLPGLALCHTVHYRIISEPLKI